MSDQNTPSSPEEVVLSIVKNAHSSFYSAMRLLPFQQRMAMYAVYAFCREIDDIADEPAPLETKKSGLAVWRNDIERTYAGMPPAENPVAVALSPFIRAYDLPKEEFMALIDGMESDLPDDMRAPTLNEVELYCRRVAGAVGVLSVHIFGDTSPAAMQFAVALGEALQLTNILRDMDEDMNIGRLYVPAEFLKEAGIDITDETPLSTVLRSPDLAKARLMMAERAKMRYLEAETLLNKIDKKKMIAAVLMMRVYQKNLRLMEKRGWDVLLPRVKPSKIWVVLTALRVAWFGK